MAPPALPTKLFEMLGPNKQTPFDPFAAQIDLFNRIQLPWPGRHKITRQPYPRIFGVCCGRRFGKTTVGEKLQWMGITAPHDQMGPPFVGLTADTEEHALKIWRLFTRHLYGTDLQGLIKDHSREHNRIELYTGGVTQLFSAKNPETLSGEGVTTWIVDEAQFLSQEAWDNLFPAVSDRKGVIVMLGVAQGEGPFKEICFKGDDRQSNPEYEHLTFPTHANPFIDKWEIDFARRTLGEARFRELYLAEWGTGSGKVFNAVREIIYQAQIHGTSQGYFYTVLPERGRVYYGGLDLARLQDWTVYTIWDRHGRLLAWDRFQGLSWKSMIDRMIRFSALWGHPMTCVDATGIGDPVFEALVDRGMNAVEYKISSNEKKRQLYDEFAIRIAAKEVRIPYYLPLLLEIERVETHVTQGSSLIRYESPRGQTDDFLMSCCLAMQVVPEATRRALPPAGGLLVEIDEDQHSAYEAIV